MATTATNDSDNDRSINTSYTNSIQNRILESDLDNMFTYHAPQYDQQARYQALRDAAHNLALMIVDYCPPSADTTAAVRKLRECIMTANASIACGE